MATRRRAELLLPSPLGLVTYDLLEDTAYLGPSRRGGLQAAPDPFPEAVAVVAAKGPDFVLRGLPGEADPAVNDAAPADVPLRDGDRLSVAGEVATFRHAARPGAASGARPDPLGVGTRPARRSVAAHRPWWITVLGLVGALMVLGAVAWAVQLLSQIKEDEAVEVTVPEPPATPTRGAPVVDPAAADFDRIRAWEEANPKDPDGALTRWQEYLRRWAGSPHATRARSRIRERVEDAAAVETARLEAELGPLLAERRFNTALEKIRRAERKYATTEAGRRLAALRQQTRDAAREALDALLARVGPRVSTDPRGARRELLAAGMEYPADLAGEITNLVERAGQLIRSRGVRDDREPPTPHAPGGANLPPGPEPLPPAGPTEGIVAEAAALEQWRDAHRALGEGRYRDAFEAYTLLVMRYAKTDVYREHTRAIDAGRYAARVGVQGPVSMLSVPAEVHRGRIEVEYTFDDGRVLERDFSLEQPFASEREVRTKVENGEVHLEGTSGLIHFMVWSDDVRIEAQVEMDVAHDVGALAIADAEEYRALVLSLGNTRFTLKKGDDARANPGHVLWFMGQGVWSDADPDAIGYIKIAERSRVKLENGDRGTIVLERKGDRCEGSYHGRSDGVSLKGSVRGDDGGGMGSARVGLFANTGVLVVRSLRIVGEVDEEWFQTRLRYLVEEDPGPGE